MSPVGNTGKLRDRPVVVGAVYNGRGQADAQHNRQSGRVGASTANAPAWFPGGTEGHAHNAVLHGLKNQALGTSQSGAGGYRQTTVPLLPGPFAWDRENSVAPRNQITLRQ